MDIAQLEELKRSELLSEWMDYVDEADVLACRKILRDTIDKLLDAGPKKVTELGPSIITEAVRALNEIDTGFICTIEREDLCEFFEDLGEQCGLSAEDIEEALENREW